MIAVEDRVRRALERGHRIDITTTGRRSGEARRIELVFHNIDGRIYISGRPGWPRSWIANLRADPHMTLHLKHGLTADLPATARVITDRVEHRDRLRNSPPLDNSVEVRNGEAIGHQKRHTTHCSEGAQGGNEVGHSPFGDGITVEDPNQKPSYQAQSQGGRLGPPPVRERDPHETA